MNRDTDGTSLIGYCTGDCLTNPPGCIGTELVTLVVIEFLYSLYETKVAFLNQIKKEHSATDITLGNRNNQTEIGFGQTLLRLYVTVLHALCQLDFLIGCKECNTTDFLQVHAYRVIDCYSFGNRQIQLRTFILLAFLIIGFPFNVHILTLLYVYGQFAIHLNIKLGGHRIIVVIIYLIVNLYTMLKEAGIDFINHIRLYKPVADGSINIVVC